MRKRFVLGPASLGAAAYFVSYAYPWVKVCVVHAYPQYAADVPGIGNAGVVHVTGPRSPASRLFWCAALTLDKLLPAPPPSESVSALLFRGVVVSGHGQTILGVGVPQADLLENQGLSGPKP
jgi:hypothetical protein